VAARRSGQATIGIIQSSIESHGIRTRDHFIREELKGGLVERLRGAGVASELFYVKSFHEPGPTADFAHLDGAMIMSERSAEPRLAWELTDMGIHCLIPFWPSALAGVASVGYDGHKGTSLAIHHLAKAGCRRIGYLGWVPVEDDYAKFRGYVSALHECGLDMRSTDLMDTKGNANPGVATTLIRRQLEQGDLPEAIVAETDFSAMEILAALAFEGVSVPDDIMVIGYNDIRNAAHVSPSLTTVRAPYHEMGVAAGEILLGWPKDGTTPEDIVLEPKLIVRDSTAQVACVDV
jgi:LacI family transcriptional regulator